MRGARRSGKRAHPLRHRAQDRHGGQLERAHRHRRKQAASQAIADGVLETWFTPAFHRRRSADLARLSQHADAAAASPAMPAPAPPSATPISPRPRGASRCRRSASSATRTARRRRTLVRSTGRSHPRRALRGDPRCRAYSLRRAAGGADRADPRLRRFASRWRASPWMTLPTPPTAIAPGWRSAARCSATRMSTAPRTPRPISTGRSRS